MNNCRKAVLLSLLMLFLLPAVASAHSLSDSYLNLDLRAGNLVTGHWLLAIEDLELATGLDSNLDARITWDEILQKQNVLRSHLMSRLALHTAGEPCAVQLGGFMLEQLSAGVFLHVPLSADCVSAAPLEVSYSLLFDIDSSHRGILTAVTDSGSQVLLFSPATSRHVIGGSNLSVLSNLWVFVVEGVWHIWIGLDHILFLCALIIPIVSGSSPTVRGPQRNAMFMEIFKVVTAFTVAHSVTLILATLEIVVLPSRLVESVIALSVAVSGVNIIWPIFRSHTWKLAFGFGLIHGFGFAGVLGDLSLPTHLFVSSLLSFNIGVEIGQLAIVLVLVPVLLLLSQAARLRKLTVATTGTLITGFGVLWLLERSLFQSLKFI